MNGSMRQRFQPQIKTGSSLYTKTTLRYTTMSYQQKQQIKQLSPFRHPPVLSSAPETSKGFREMFQQVNVSKQEVEQLFEKKFQYQQKQWRTENAAPAVWQLPPPDELFGEYYQLETLQQLKQRLNDVKCKLNDYSLEDWSSHTQRKDPAGEVPWRLRSQTKAEFVTVAWCKFFECLHRFPLVQRPQLNSLHLCEAPGAFVAALNHFLHSNYERDEVRWNWLSTTLNPYYEGNALSKMIVDDRFMLYSLRNWLFHEDFTGNIMERRNIEQIRAQVELRLGEVHLITADGSIDCVEAPDCQEEIVATLNFAEITAALSILAEGGSLLVKMFTLFEATSVCKLYLLNCAFEQVHLFKPATSKRGNSELYVICLGYKRETPHLREILARMLEKVGESEVLPLFKQRWLPRDFLLQHEIGARLFLNLQSSAIEANIAAYELRSRKETKRSELMRKRVCGNYFKRYRVQPIAIELTLLHQRRQEGRIEEGHKTAIYRGSHSERELLKETSTEQQIFMLRGALNELEKSLTSGGDDDGGGLSLELSQFPVSEEIPQLRIYRGAPFAKLLSSLFVTVQVLMLRHKLLRTLNVDAAIEGSDTPPKCTLESQGATSVEIEMNSSLSCDNISLQQQRQLVRLLDALLAHRPQQLIFWNFPFLTHLSVSVLRFLSLRVFRKLSFATQPEFVATLAEASYKENEVAAITELRDLLVADPSILCVMDIELLHRNEFCRALTEFNNLLLLRNLRLILHN